jgi:hypothetical protein
MIGDMDKYFWLYDPLSNSYLLYEDLGKHGTTLFAECPHKEQVVWLCDSLNKRDEEGEIIGDIS